MIAGIEIEIGSCNPDHAPFMGGLSSLGYDWYILPVGKIWRFSLKPFQRYHRGAKNLKWVTWPWPCPFKESFVISMLVLDIAYLCTNFDHYSFSRCRDMVGTHQNLNSLRDLTTPLSGNVCHPMASTWYDQPVYQIWSLYLHQILQATLIKWDKSAVAIMAVLTRIGSRSMYYLLVEVAGCYY